MKKNSVIFCFGVLVLALAGLQRAEAAATCFCKISKDVLNTPASSGVCQDLTAQANLTFTGPFQQGADNQQKCNNRCAEIIQPLINSQSVGAACCAIGAPIGTKIYAYSAVGTKAYRDVPSFPPYASTPTLIGVITDAHKITEVRCPSGWLANTTNVNGGITADGKCKKLSGTISITPLPANGTQVDTYGFTWGNQVYAWGTAANLGAAVTSTYTQVPAVCGF